MSGELCTAMLIRRGSGAQKCSHSAEMKQPAQACAAGGLLAGVVDGDVDAVLSRLKSEGFPEACVIGEVLAREAETGTRVLTLV
jgi:hypothetical protein